MVVRACRWQLLRLYGFERKRTGDRDVPRPRPRSLLRQWANPKRSTKSASLIECDSFRDCFVVAESESSSNVDGAGKNGLRLCGDATGLCGDATWEGISRSIARKWCRQARRVATCRACFSKPMGRRSSCLKKSISDLVVTFHCTVSFEVRCELLNFKPVKDRFQPTASSEEPKKSLGDDADAITREDRWKAAEELGERIGVSAACRALNVSPATLYRRKRQPQQRPRPKPSRALSDS